MPWLLPSHADLVREALKAVKRQAYDANERMRSGAKEHARFRSSKRWQKVRGAQLAAYPACKDPYDVHGTRLEAASQVDHIVPLAQGGARLARNNLQSLCTACHARKSQAERRDDDRA